MVCKPMSGPLRFYKVPDPYGYFSNFSRHPIQLDGKTWPTTEHYYQAQKFAGSDEDWMEAIRQDPRPGNSRTMGNDREHPIRPNWDAIKFDVMMLALIAKFTQHPDCCSMILGTADRHIIEDTRQGKDDDHVWGDGSTGTGQNLLGKALMALRDALRGGEKAVAAAEQLCRQNIANGGR